MKIGFQVNHFLFDKHDIIDNYNIHITLIELLIIIKKIILSQMIPSIVIVI